MEADESTVAHMPYHQPTQAELDRHGGSAANYRFETVKSLLGEKEAKALFRRVREDRGARVEFRRLYQRYKNNPQEPEQSNLFEAECRVCPSSTDIFLVPCGHTHMCKMCLERWAKTTARDDDTEPNQVDCGTCRQACTMTCSIKWVIEDPDEFYQRARNTRKAAQKRTCIKKKDKREDNRKKGRAEKK